METSLLNHWFQKVRVTYWVSDKAQLKAVRFCRNYGFDNKRIIGLSAVIYTAALRFARNRSGYFFAVIKSPKLIFISLKRTSFPIFRNAHLKWFRVISSRKNFLLKNCSKMKFLINQILAIFKYSPIIHSYINNPVIRLKSFVNTSYTNR